MTKALSAVGGMLIAAIVAVASAPFMLAYIFGITLSAASLTVLRGLLAVGKWAEKNA